MNILEKATILYCRYTPTWKEIKSINNNYHLLDIALTNKIWFFQGLALNLINNDYDLGDIDISLDNPNPQYFFASFNRYPFNFNYSENFPKFCEELKSKFQKGQKYKSEYVWEFAKAVLKETLEKTNAEKLDEVHDEKALVDIALTTYNKDVRCKIVNKYGFELFSYIARQRLGYNISKGYIKNYQKQNTLKYIALNDPNKYVRLKAIENMTDNDILYGMIETDISEEFKTKCVNNMTDKMLLNKIKQHSYLHYPLCIDDRLEKLNNNEIKTQSSIEHSISLDEVDKSIKNSLFADESILEHIINNSSKALQIQASNKLKNQYKLVKHSGKIIAIK
ncbi:hypothetical protein [Methanobrevibacter millerae]|uniref:Uncharacterized protein n=1 Tax=Methanobrevibacter millerae TaxID=230361 RepID=A0A1G5VRW1_9EURY|nr:hypothetical protein [Methanobrevibacter millerae]SDA48630.1 hypothetical protein SAMN02910315_00831 [Methanobrevibacter millerae]